MRLALIGDIHSFTLRLHPRRMLSRRIMGQSNLWLNRRFRFNHGLLDALFEQVRAIEPDLVLLSGDVTTTSLEDEFLDVERYLRPLSEQFRTILVPGNHDRYTFRAAKARRIERMMHGILPDEFPHFEALTDKWRLLALDSATPGFMLSRGALGPTQMQGTLEHLEEMTADQGVIVLCHYPVALPAGIPNSWAHALAEERRLRQMLGSTPGRVVFLHGHVHRPWYWDTAADNGNERKPAPFANINAGSPCLTSGRYPLGQGFWQITLPDRPADPLGLVHHVPMPVGDSHATGLARSRLRRRARGGSADFRWEPRQVL